MLCIVTVANAEQATVTAETSDRKVGVVSRRVLCGEWARLNGVSTGCSLQIGGACNDQISMC